MVPPDSALTQMCKRPTLLPEGGITQKDVERLWITDRQNLLQCGRRHGALVAFIKDRDALLSP